MTRARVVLIVAIVAHTARLGAARDGRLSRRSHAFRVALSPLWPYEQFHIPPGRLVYLSVASALTNVVFVADRDRGARGRCADALAAARSPSGSSAPRRLLNLHWPISMGDSAADLRVGYYVWIASFVLLLLGVTSRDRAAPALDLASRSARQPRWRSGSRSSPTRPCAPSASVVPPRVRPRVRRRARLYIILAD